MLSKELFIHACDLIKKKRGDAEALCNALELCSPQEQVNVFIYTEYEDLVVSILHEAFGFPKDDDMLEWWIWDKSLGETFVLGDYKVDDKDIDLSIPEKFYDFVIEYLKEKN